jgi:hypothetical protein
MRSESFIPPDERILLIEDTAEIQLAQSNLVRFEARREQNGVPAVSIRDLLKAALRHRPDRILLGEIRGSEAFDLLQLLTLATPALCPQFTPVPRSRDWRGSRAASSRGGVELPYRAIKSNIGDSLNVVIQIERRPGRRFILRSARNQQLRSRCRIVRLLRDLCCPTGACMTELNLLLRRDVCRLRNTSWHFTSQRTGVCCSRA